MFIYRAADRRHNIRSAFTRGALRGYIYIECRMNEHSRELLLKMPGLLATKHGIQIKKVEPKDYTKLLTMRTARAIERYSWVRISKGLYRGDEGIVCAAEDWGVSVLLVPRFEDATETHKRKSMANRPVPRLLNDDPGMVADTSATTTTSLRRQTSGGSKFENGLVLKRFDFLSVSNNALDTSVHLFKEFTRSKHSILAKVPLLRPREWYIETNDLIVDKIDGQEGIIESVSSTYVEAYVENEGTRQVPWVRVQKIVNVGEEVTVMAGRHTRTSGFVTSVGSDIATLVFKQQNSGTSSSVDNIQV